MRRLLAFVQKPPGINPGQLFRLEQWAPYLEREHGITLDFVAFESKALTRVVYTRGNVARKGALMLGDLARRAVPVVRARGYDGAVVFREVATLGPAIWERVLSRLGVPYVFDFDDAVWMAASDGPRPVNGIFSRLRFPEKTAKIVELAGAVSAGNQFLADYARARNGNVHVVPTSVDLARYDVQPPLPFDDPFVIGWIGSHSTRAFLEEVREAVERFGKTRKTRFVVVCNEPLEKPFANVENVFVKWREDHEVADIGTMHAGIMPLIDLPFAHGKCGLKGLQYMAAGRPAILSPIGVNKDIVRHGENGMLARTTDDWIACFAALAESRELRERLAAAGRKTVEDGYSATASAAKFARAVESML